MATGRIVGIFTAPTRGAPMIAHESVEAIAARGLVGDRYLRARGSFSGQRIADEERAVTLIEREAVEAVRAEHGIALAAAETRRNLVTTGVALNDLVGRTFSVGDIELRGVDLADPCAYLESLTREGVQRALVERGGLRAAIVTGGTLHVGDFIDVGP